MCSYICSAQRPEMNLFCTFFTTRVSIFINKSNFSFIALVFVLLFFCCFLIPSFSCVFRLCSNVPSPCQEIPPIKSMLSTVGFLGSGWKEQDESKRRKHNKKNKGLADFSCLSSSDTLPNHPVRFSLPFRSPIKTDSEKEGEVR